MFIDIGDGEVSSDPGLRVCLNAAHADEADRLTWYNVGDENKPIFLNGSGEPVECDDILAVGISGGLYDINKQLRNIGTSGKPIYFKDGLPVQCDDTLSVNINGNAATATQANKANEADIAEVAVGATSLIDLVTLQPLEKVGDENTPVYFLNGIPTPCNTLKLPQQGDVDTPIYIDENGIPQSCIDFLPLTAGPNKKISGPLGLTLDQNYGLFLPTSGFEGEIFFVEDSDTLGLPSGGTAGQIIVKNSEVDGDATWQDFPQLNYLSINGGTIIGTTESVSTTTGALTIAGGLGVSKNIYGTKVYGAVWNDYAEYRNQEINIKPGYCVASKDNGQVYKTIEKFQACDGIVSDTFGFAIGETENCKTPLAVAGRVLAYFHGNREDYHAGDTVCAGPEGKVMKMTRKEICEYPDRIIGIVSEIPEYETWGTNDISVNGRIWIKVK